MSLSRAYSHYNFQRRYERLQVVLAWTISYAWVVPYVIFNIVFIFAGSSLVVMFLATSEIPASTRVVLFPIITGVIALGVGYFNLPQLHVLQRIRKQYRNAKNLAGLEELPPTLKNVVTAQIKRLADRMVPEHQEKVAISKPLRFWFERNNHKATPSMMVTSGIVNLIFPLGFFKVARQDPDAADAMVAHELAHFLHHDSGLLLAVRCYLRASLVMFYYIGIGVLLTAVICGVQWGILGDERKMVAFRLAEQQNARASQQLNPYTGSFFTLDHGPSYSEIYDQRLLSQIDKAQLMLMLRVGVSLSMFYYYFFQTFYLRRRVRRSEELADFFAALTTTPDAVSRFLAQHVAEQKSGFFSLHPPINKRIRKLEKYQRLLATSR